ncbi:MAG: Flp1 family type IVb pilin [Eubacterium sp.]
MLDNLLIKALIAKNRIRTFLKDEKGEVNVVAIIVLIAVAIVTAGVFKEQIGNLVVNLFKNLTTKGQTAIGE